ncbi:MAG: TRAP transporter small permease [Lautropia sp.]|nr:MAG: TRAP transporter small permease subunit [Pseudomonadota bacterium]MBC6958801.1 TRAP transporter small permease [Lautropia sp.]MDL1907815.1 TRAP transporter small permease subunit [Betaproteobacteria bacterium PRO1]RIK89371.1 MAG: TRAP transporter permease DctQ [Burkholderiales bacterium]
MPRWLAATTAAITRLNRIVFMVTIWLMAVIVTVMLYEVLARYIFNAPTVWGMELAVLLFGPYFLLGGPYLLHLRGHVSLDLARQRLPARINRWLDLLNFPVIVAFCLILLVFSAPAAISSFEYRETSFSAWNPPIWWAKASVPIALALMLLQALAEFAHTLYSASEVKRGDWPSKPEGMP